MSARGGLVSRVTLADIDTDGCQQVSAQIEQAGSQALVVSCNVAEKADVEAAVQQTVERFGQLDILVNNAGVLRDNLLFKMSDDDWETVMNVHLRGASSVAGQRRPIWSSRNMGALSRSHRPRQSWTGQLLHGEGRSARIDAHTGPRTGTLWDYRQRGRSWLHRH
jgi:NAD(P)-dependent dehydrogenase (short-subunit alcohol dehydrogenase family)